MNARGLQLGRSPGVVGHTNPSARLQRWPSQGQRLSDQLAAAPRLMPRDPIIFHSFFPAKRTQRAGRQDKSETLREERREKRERDRMEQSKPMPSLHTRGHDRGKQRRRREPGEPGGSWRATCFLGEERKEWFSSSPFHPIRILLFSLFSSSLTPPILFSLPSVRPPSSSSTAPSCVGDKFSAHF